MSVVSKVQRSFSSFQLMRHSLDGPIEIEN